MTQVLFVQGAGEGVHDKWDNHLVDNLRSALGPAYEVRYPVMPNETDPTFAAWCPVVRRELELLQDGAVAVGHSVGGMMLINVLAEWRPKASLAAIVLLAAPFIGKGGWPSDEIEANRDLAGTLPPTVPVFLYHGESDAVVPLPHVGLYAAALPRAHVCRLAGRDHQLNNDLSDVARDIRSLGPR